jgi:hypothetical protein
MNSLQICRRVFSTLLSAAAITVFSGGLAVAQQQASAVPTNAHAKSYGAGWDCDRGYQVSKGACVAMKIPAHAFLTPSGDRWRCGRGYRQTAKACIAVKVPKNTYLVEAAFWWTVPMAMDGNASGDTARSVIGARRSRFPQTPMLVILVACRGGSAVGDIARSEMPAWS